MDSAHEECLFQPFLAFAADIDSLRELIFFDDAVPEGDGRDVRAVLRNLPGAWKTLDDLSRKIERNSRAPEFWKRIELRHLGASLAVDERKGRAFSVGQCPKRMAAGLLPIEIKPGILKNVVDRRKISELHELGHIGLHAGPQLRLVLHP